MANTSAQIGRRESIRRFIAESLELHPRDIIGHTAAQFKTSRQAVSQHLKQMIEEGLVIANGNTRARVYEPAKLGEFSVELKLSDSIAEDVIWREEVRPILTLITDEALRICEYAFTEMLNNAIDHSEGARVTVLGSATVSNVWLVVHDDGVGIFSKIKRELGLADERHAILELAKGKFTTDPSRHSGEGIFFTSRAVDAFNIASGKLLFAHTPKGRDWLLDELSDILPPAVQAGMDGTLVAMKINPNANRSLTDVFDDFASPEDYGFRKTHIPVSLARYGDENLVSRSQAKRLLARVERFEEVVLDFTGITSIGQAFADEVFRVFTAQHPEVHVRVAHATPEVERMIQRARAAP